MDTTLVANFISNLSGKTIIPKKDIECKLVNNDLLEGEVFKIVAGTPLKVDPETRSGWIPIADGASGGKGLTPETQFSLLIDGPFPEKYKEEDITYGHPFAGWIENFKETFDVQ